MIGFGFGFGFSPLGALLNQNEPEVDVYITGLSTPLSSGQITKLNTLVAALKSGLGISALSDAFDVLYLLAGETAESGLKNLVKNAHHALAVNSPTFTQFEGFKGNGTSAYVNTNYTVMTEAVNVTQNNASYGIYVRVAPTVNSYQFGSDSGSDTGLRLNTSGLISRYAVHSEINLVNSASNFNNSVKRGMAILSRINATSQKIRINKALVVSNTNNSILTPNLPFNLLKYAASYDDSQIAMFCTSRLLTDSEADLLTDAIEAYMDSNGKGVIA